MRDLGAMNPVPYPTQAANSIAWIAYSYVIVPTNKSGSALLFWCNEIGFLMGIFFSLSLYGLARTKTRDRILAQMLFYALIIPLIGAVGLLSELSQNQPKLMWGFTANGILLLYYAAPLSTIVSVVKTKSAKSINLPLACAQCVNGLLWLGYGLAVSDLFIWIPNAVGACTGALLIFLLFIYRSRRRGVGERPGDGGDAGNVLDRGKEHDVKRVEDVEAVVDGEGGEDAERWSEEERGGDEGRGTRDEGRERR